MRHARLVSEMHYQLTRLFYNLIHTLYTGVSKRLDSSDRIRHDTLKKIRIFREKIYLTS